MNLNELILSRIENGVNPITGRDMAPNEEVVVVNYNGTECMVPKEYIHYKGK